MRNINNSDNRINVDSKNYSTIARFRQEDDATLVVNLYKNREEFDVSNQTITLRALRVDGQSINQTDNITKNKNIVTINLRRNILAVIGRTSIQLNISDSAGQFTTAEFFIEVEKNNLGSDALKGSDNIQALHQILIDFKAEKSSLIKNITDDYNSLKKIIIDQNQAANLQNQINLNKQQSVENTSRIEQLEDLTPVWQQYEGTGNITVNDSFDGITKDLTIKGITLKNEIKIASWSNGNTYAYTTTTMNLKPLTIYTAIAIGYTSNVKVFTFGNNGASNPLFDYSDITKPIKFTTREVDPNAPIGFVKPQSGGALTNTDIDNIKFIILEGDWTNKTLPFRTCFDSITSSGESEDNKIKIKSIGNNLLDVNACVMGGFDSNTGEEVTSTNGKRSDFINVESNTGYRLDLEGELYNCIYEYDLNKKFIKRSNANTYIPRIITTSQNTKYIRVVLDKLVIQPMLVKGTKATNYEQYRAKLIEIPLPFQKGLKSTLDGSVYDEINGNTGEIIQRVSDEYVALSKPVIHKINDIQLNTFDETTHITQENNILSDINFKAKVSLSSQAKRLTEENKALKEENRELREDTNTIVDSLISVFEPMLLPYDDNAEEEQKIILEKLYAIKNR